MGEAATSTPNRMTRRRQRTREQILKATQTLVLEHGYEEASAEAIAEHADLGRSTFYNHFDNKQEAVLALLTQHYRDYGEAAYIPLEETRDRAQSMLRSTIQVFRAMAADPLTRQLAEKPRMLAKAIAESQMEFLVKDLTEGVMQDRFDFVVTPDSGATIVTWAYVGMLMRAVAQDTAEETSLEWGRFLMLNLGIERDEIEGLVKNAIEE